MPENEALLEQQKLQEPILKTQQQEESELLNAHLATLRSWDVGEGQTLEERRSAEAQRIVREEEANVALHRAVQRQAPPVQAKAAAQGQPQQVQAPAGQTYKEKQAEKKKLKEAQKNCPIGTLETYQMVHTLLDIRQNRRNSLTDARLKAANEADVDTRALQSFCEGYRADKKGRPLTRLDQKKQQWDNHFLDDYMSKDVERRKPYLKEMTDEFLSVRIKSGAITPTFVKKNLAHLKTLGDKLCYFENIYKDPVNAPYFEGLSQYERDLIQVQFGVGPALNGLVTARLAGEGVDFSGTLSHYVSEKSYIDQNRESLPIYEEIYENGVQAEAQGLNAAVNQEIDRRKVQGWEQNKRVAAELKGHMAEEGLNIDLNGFATKYSYDTIRDFQKMIENNPDLYQQNKALIDQVYQELYRAVDALGDVVGENMALQYVCDKIHDKWGQTPASHEKSILTAIGIRQEGTMRHSDLIIKRLGGLGDIARHYLRGKEMSDDGRRALELLRGGGAAAEAPDGGPQI